MPFTAATLHTTRQAIAMEEEDLGWGMFLAATRIHDGFEQLADLADGG